MTAGLIPMNLDIAAKPVEWDDPYALLEHDAGEDLEQAFMRGIVFWAHHVVTPREKPPALDPRAAQLRALIATRRREIELRLERRRLRIEDNSRSDALLPSWWLSPSEQRDLTDRTIRQARV